MEIVFESFADLAVVVNFVESLSLSLQLPPVSGKKMHIFAPRLEELAAELVPLKTQVDLTDFAVPIDNLKEPGMTQGALNTLDHFIVSKTGAKMGSL